MPVRIFKYQDCWGKEGENIRLYATLEVPCGGGKITYLTNVSGSKEEILSAIEIIRLNLGG